MTGEYKLPWTRLHALKDYYGMVQVLDAFPEVRQTFNLVPSMLVQIKEYAEAKAADPFLRAALKPAEELDEQERAFILRYFFQAHPGRLIRRYPRYGELYDGWQAADRDARRARHFFNGQTMRDLQVLSQVAWFDEEFLEKDEEIRELVNKGRDYTLADQELMGRKQIGILGHVVKVYQEFAANGRIEVTTTPFYHPILPLLCDSNIAAVSHPYVPLPPPFRYPEDARHQLKTARQYMEQEIGIKPRGLWPSEGSVSDEVFTIAADEGFHWAATDNGVLGKTLHHVADVTATYRPYVWKRDGREMRVIFRDHYLSDLVGFVYSRMGSADAATHLLDRIRENCAHILGSGRDALVPVILDGENAWEHYELNGRPFLKELYRRIQQDPTIEAVTVSEALEKVEPQVLSNIFPGSWINANFDIWIGAEEDNKAWEYLLRARQAYEAALGDSSLSEANRKLAFEELLIAEGSDWCWWYGPEHFSDNREEFDHLYRSHLANVYVALGQEPPDELSRPILRTHVTAQHHEPTAPVRPVIDGEVTSYFEWMGAGLYTVDDRSGAMHGHRYLIQEVHYGCDGMNLYLRVDFPVPESAIQVNLHFEKASWSIEVEEGGAKLLQESPLEVAYRRVLEIKTPLAAIGVARGEPARVRLSIWQGSLPVDAAPREGWLSLPTAEPGDWPL